MSKFVDFIMQPYINLAFAVFCGINYYMVVLRFIRAHTAFGGDLLGFFFLPAIVAGGGLIALKLMKKWQENDMRLRMNAFVIMNILLAVFNIIFIIAT